MVGWYIRIVPHTNIILATTTIIIYQLIETNTGRLCHGTDIHHHVRLHWLN